MRIIWRLFLLFYFLMLSISLAHAETLTLGVLAVRPKAEEQKRWQPLADYLTHSLGVDNVELRIVDFAEAEQQLQRSELDFLISSPSYYISLHENNALVSVVATLIDFVDGKELSAFGGVIFCLQERSDINNLYDLTQKKIAIISQLAFGGYQMQRYELLQAGIHLQDSQLLKTQSSHDNVVNAVLAKQADVGFVSTSVLENMAKEHKLDLSRIKIINQQPLPSYPFLLSTRLYPQWPIVALPHVDAQLVRKMTISLLQLEPNHPIMSAMGLYGFTVPADYNSVEQLLRELRLPPFDDTPKFTLADVWQRYHQPLLVLIITGGVIGLLTIALLFKNHQLNIAQQYLRENEQYLKRLMDRIPIPLSFADKQGRIIYSNTRFFSIFGYSLQEIPTIQAWMEHAYPDPNYRQQVIDIWNNAVQQSILSGQEEIQPFEYNVTCKNGEIRTMEISGVLTDDASLAIFIDLTDSKQAKAELKKHHDHLEQLVEQRTEQLIQAKEAAEAANIAKSTFITTMSHELRTPLNAILGFSELMSLDEKITSNQKNTLSIINRSGKHLLSMINDVLEISKIESGHFALDNQPCNLLGLFEDLSNMFSIRAANKELSFSMDIAANTPSYIYVDNGKLRQVLINLLGNAIKFTRQGSVVLRCYTESISTEQLQLTIEIIDTGIGIPTDKQQDLFKPFVQLARIIDTEGTGLGLAISKSLIERMGGQIHVQSVVNKGSTFQFSIPVTIANTNNIKLTTPTRMVKGLIPNQPEWRLLIVDDNLENRLLLLSLLNKAGFDVMTAENGLEAISAFETWHPDLIWMDMRMPIMDGYQATKKIRQMAEGNKVKIISVSASAFKEQHDAMINAGCDAVIHKPIQANEVFDILANYLGAQFIYQDSETDKSLPNLKLTTDIVNQLPIELRQQLHEAAINLDIEETETIINDIEKIAPEIARSLQTLAQAYQFEHIVELSKS